MSLGSSASFASSEGSQDSVSFLKDIGNAILLQVPAGGHVCIIFRHPPCAQMISGKKGGKPFVLVTFGANAWKNVRNPNHHYLSRKCRNTPPICSAIRLQFVLKYFWCPIRPEEREMLSVLLPFVSQYAFHLHCNTPPICVAVLLGKSWWLWSPDVPQIQMSGNQRTARRASGKGPCQKASRQISTWDPDCLVQRPNSWISP